MNSSANLLTGTLLPLKKLPFRHVPTLSSSHNPSAQFSCSVMSDSLYCCGRSRCSHETRVVAERGRHQGSGGQQRWGRCCGQQARSARGQQRGGASSQQAGHGQLGAPGHLQPLQLPLLLDLLDHLVDNSLVFLQGGRMAYWPVVPRVILP